jgi:soluble lytic murein transglycosylase
MTGFLLHAIPLLVTLFTPAVEEAFDYVKRREWQQAAEALDRAYAEDPAAFGANSLHYLRGRVAAAQNDWQRALDEFALVGGINPLRPLAAWHGARAALALGDFERARLLIEELPKDFPADLKLQLARAAPPGLALLAYDGVTAREARFQRALLSQDAPAIWALLRENNRDDIALEGAHLLRSQADTPRRRMDLAATFMAHRQFGDAVPLYQELVSDPDFSAEAQMQLARTKFLTQDYVGAIEAYARVKKGFPGTDFEKDADYQIANSYWRSRQYPEAEKAYADHMARFSGNGVIEGAVRDLADIYRSQGADAKALALIDRTLSRRPSTAGRQVLLFTKAKILFNQKRYAQARDIFRQLGAMTLRSTANATTTEEARYFEALSLSRMGSNAAATAIWKRLAAGRSYYGYKSAERLHGRPAGSAADVCMPNADAGLQSALQRLESRKRPPRLTLDEAPRDPVSELIYLGLWDEASLWLDRAARPDFSLVADLSYAGGHYHRAISAADRVFAANPSVLPLVYPAAFRETICSAAAPHGVDPLWLHAIIWQESKYNPNAHSAAAARGLMQFIPDTAQAIAPAAGISNLTLKHLYDPEVSIRLGAYYWASLLAEFKQPELALAAYNGGPDNVRRWRDKLRGNDSDPELFVSEIGFVETKRYVQAVFGARAAYDRLR